MTDRPEPVDRRRALAHNAVGPALNTHGEWLPLSVREAIADAVLAAVDGETPGPLPALQALRARLVDERDRAKERQPGARFPGSLYGISGVAAGLTTAIYLVGCEMVRHGGIVPDNPRTTLDNPVACDDHDGLRERYAAAIRNAVTRLRDVRGYDAECADAVLTVRDTELEQLRADLAALRAVATGYCPHCGRGDAAPTPDQYLVQVHRADTAEAKVARVRALAADMRTWCSPYNIAVDYAQRIDDALNGPKAPDSSPADEGAVDRCYWNSRYDQEQP